ncbi:hypothetical protein F4779DRAFT_622690 [Xylariaceae sp. FL0662B]|nr:hypothetical protein F4779DRAFT_622690 [Xylariaceae sp. FL0662B]
MGVRMRGHMASLRETRCAGKRSERPKTVRALRVGGRPSERDRIAEPQGSVMKVFNVKGEISDAGQDYPAADIELSNAPTIKPADIKTARDIFDLGLRYGDSNTERYSHPKSGPNAELQLRHFHTQYDAEFLSQVLLLEILGEQSVQYACAAWDEKNTLGSRLQRSLFQTRKLKIYKTLERLYTSDPWYGLVDL